MRTRTQDKGGIGGDVFDVRDVIARFEELEEQVNDEEIPILSEEREEFEMLKRFLEEVKGYGGDEQWRGDWYPVAFIADSHFEAYAQELAEDCGMVNRDATWPNNFIDWEAAAEVLQTDYSSVEVDGTTYWYR